MTRIGSVTVPRTLSLRPIYYQNVVEDGERILAKFEATELVPRETRFGVVADVKYERIA